MNAADETGVLPAYWLRGAELMHQQCWCWGQDVRRPEGNLLIEYGFERSRPPADVTGSSRYSLRRDGTLILLWGFGVAYAREDIGAIYVNRYCFVLRWMGECAAAETVWHAHQMTLLAPPATRRQIRRSRKLLQALMRWIASYESWVEAACGASYRARTLARWDRAAISADRMAAAWELLARHVEEPPP